MKKIPGLKSLKSLNLFVTYPEDIVCFVSLCRKVALGVFFCVPDFEGIILNAFIDEPLTALRVLTWIGMSSFNTEVILRMVECCPSLEILSANYVWTRSGNKA